ncbi:MAG: hypothetical protein BWZ10_00707 [candidate division BRC1 bacterium ADurb.BinA364]|nr:MAG: hypothetical protein BWZ10_00707 [candidate division BRC1 bacterium ADurb.BinA364]
MLSAWIGIGCGLRFLNLGGKPLWTDEFGTLGLALGRGFEGVARNEPIGFDQLMAPMRGGATAGFLDAARATVREDVHPPLYFGLLNRWLRFIAPDAGAYVTAWQMRSLGAALGAAAIAAMAWLGWISFGTAGAAHASAWLIAVSPFGVFLSQEARMYSLAVVWIALSLGFFLIALRRARQGAAPPAWLFVAWALANGLGMATHYFQLFALLAQCAAMAALAAGDWKAGRPWTRAAGWRMVLFGAATAILAAPFFPILASLPNHEMALWLHRRFDDWHYLIDPLPEILAATITFFYILPVQNVPNWIAVASAALAIPFWLWSCFFWRRGYSRLYPDDPSQQTGAALGWIFLFSLAILLGITYFSGMFLTSALRYSFFLFPIALLWAAGGIDGWIRRPSPRLRRRLAACAALGLLGAATVSLDFGYSKTQQPELVAEEIVAHSAGPVAVAIAHRRTWCQTAELQAVAWALERDAGRAESAMPVRYVLATGTKNDPPTYRDLDRALERLEGPLDFWALNFAPDGKRFERWMRERGFAPAPLGRDRVGGFLIEHYRRL